MMIQVQKILMVVMMSIMAYTGYSQCGVAPTVTPGSRCGTGTVSLSASSTTAGVFRWYNAATGGAALQTSLSATSSSYPTVSISTTTTYYVTFHNGTCESTPRTPVVATVNSIPAAPTVVAGSRCGAGTVTVTANSTTAGTFKWYSASTGGSLLQASTSGLTTNNYAPTISTTTTFYVTITNANNCESATRRAVVATINTVPAAPTVTPGSTCGPGNVVLAANSASAGTFKWYSAATGGSPLQTSTAGLTTHNFTAVSLSTTTTYYVSVTNSSNCESGRTAITATVNANSPATAPSVTPGSRCGTGTVALSASSATAGTFRWYTTLTGGQLLHTSTSGTSSTYTTVSIGTTTTYYVTFNNGTCESTPRKAIVATINPLATAPTTVAASRCGSGSVTLTANSASAGTFKWYAALTGGTPLRTSLAAQTTDSYPLSVSTTTTYYVTFSNATCESTPRKAVIATVNAVPAAPTIVAGSRCGPGTVSLTANSATAGTFKWYDASTGGNLLQTSTAAQTTNVFTIPALAATTTYYVTITNSNNCESATRTAVTATINPFPVVYDITGGGMYTTTVPASVGLSGSVTSTSYQLQMNGVNSGSAIAGTGYSLSWNTSTEGTYTVQAMLGSCTAMMNGSAKVESQLNYALNEFAFLYKYDGRRRMSHKKIPGADWVYMVYDNRDRLVMTQDGNQRLQNQWTFTKYDALNRPVLTGIYTHGSTVDQATMQGVVNTYYDNLATNNGSWYETFSSSGAVHGYDNKSYPPVSDVNQYLTVTYYDDYGFKALYSNDPANDYRPSQLEEKSTPTGTYNQADWNQLVKGQLTGTKTKILGSTTFLLSVVYYDDKYRTVQTITDNHKGGKDCHTTMYDFTGNVLATNTMHAIPTLAERKVLRTFDYDHAGRLLKTWQKIGSESTILISKNEYNEIGELVTKNLHSINQGASFKQQVDYRYTIRGWLSRINNADLNSADGGPKDYFGMNLHYEKLQADIANTPLFDGTPSAIQWSQNQGLGLPTFGHLTEQAYTLEYDALGRLTNALNKAKSTLWQPGQNNEEKIAYDLNGNLNSILRKSSLGNLDHLQYKYGRGNQLKSVFDYGFAGLGFYDGNKTDEDFTYDLVGNLKKDLNKGISSFQYNELNLISQIDKSDGATVKSVYSADGIKLKEEVYQAGSTTASSTIDFAGQFVYVNGALEHLAFEEGKVVLNASHPEYQYYIKDHLDNIRVTFTTKVDQTIVTATYEDANLQGESADFNPSYDKANRISTTLYNHTVGGEKSQRLSAAGSNDIVGLAKSIYVVPGDTIKLSVYAKYYTPTTNNTNVAGQIATAISSSFGLSALSTGEAAKAYQSLNSIYAPGPFIGSDEWENAAAPKAFLNYILFDKNYVPYDFGFDQISTNALETGSNVPHDKLELTALARVPGYIYVFLSNENDKIVDVFFDDLTITHVHSPVIQSDDYYPFGLSIKETSYQRGNTNYEGLVTAQGLGLKDIGFRQYDPVLGRFHGIDPLAELELGLSPYQFAGNSPIENVDLLGLNIFDKVKELVKKVTYKIRLKINPRSTVYNPRRSGPGRVPSSSSNRPKPTGGNKPAPVGKTYTKPDKQEKRFIELASIDDESEDDKDDLLKRLMWDGDEGNRDGVLGTARSGNGYAPIRQKPRTPGPDGEAMPKKEDHSPLLVPQSYEVARTSTDLNKLRSHLYSRHSVNEARAILAMATFSKQSKQVFSPLAANLFSVASANAIFIDQLEKINPPPFPVYLRTGISVTIEGYESILRSFIITTKPGGPENNGLVVTKVEAGEHTPARTEHQAVFDKLAKKMKEYIGDRVFANEKEINDFIQDHGNGLVSYRDQLLQNINDNDGVTDLSERTDGSNPTASLAAVANLYKTKFNVDSKVVILDKDRAKQLADEYKNGRQPNRDVIVIIGRNEGQPLTRYLVTKDGFFDYSTERQKTMPDGTVVTEHYTGTKEEIDDVIEYTLEKAVNNRNLVVGTNEQGQEITINPDTAPELNIFQKYLMMCKLFSHFLKELSVKPENWDSQLKDQNNLPVQIPDALAGPGTAVLDETKSIPETIM
ncbi:MAG: hypothetical protein LW863_05580, partial [Flammeovirgaceae bacterium]|nr:hypothetical protein [Flammeovirgaceae bacterium]